MTFMNPAEVYFITCGTLTVPESTVIENGSTEEAVKLSFHSFLVKINKRIVLINTGFPLDTNEIERFWLRKNPIQKLVIQSSTDKLLRALSLKKSDVDYLILTPLVQYSTGRAGSFENAKILISTNGWKEVVIPQVKNNSEDLLPRGLYFDRYTLFSLITDRFDHLLPIDHATIEDINMDIEHAGYHHTSSLVLKFRLNGINIAFTDGIFTMQNYKERIPVGATYKGSDAHKLFEKLDRCDTVIPLMQPYLERFLPSHPIASDIFSLDVGDSSL